MNPKTGNPKSESSATDRPRTGVWIVGLKGGVATTLVVGALALARGRSGSHGMITESELFDGIDLPGLDTLVFGGHDIRQATLLDSARQIHRDTGTISRDLLDELEPELEQIETRVRPGLVYHSGPAIDALADDDRARRNRTPAEALQGIVDDLTGFRDDHQLDQVILVNLASTEPGPPPHPGHGSAAGIEALLAEDDPEAVIASTIYSVAAARVGAAYVNFTPSPGALLPGVVELLEQAGLPFMGSDGKTGETLVKSALAPLFKYRNLRVLSWQGYNMLGDRDGEVLASEENRATKVASKDNLLREYLGYPLHSKVTIDYVPSLDDFKTAWDFIHFEGFLGHRMSLQFTWQGCDSILAAPIVLDLIRLMAVARRRGESGPQTQLSLFFKSPHGVPEHDLHFQFHRLIEYVAALKAS